MGHVYENHIDDLNWQDGHQRWRTRYDEGDYKLPPYFERRPVTLAIKKDGKVEFHDIDWDEKYGSPRCRSKKKEAVLWREAFAWTVFDGEDDIRFAQENNFALFHEDQPSPKRLRRRVLWRAGEAGRLAGKCIADCRFAGGYHVAVGTKVEELTGMFERLKGEAALCMRLGAFSHDEVALITKHLSDVIGDLGEMRDAVERFDSCYESCASRIEAHNADFNKEEQRPGGLWFPNPDCRL